MAFGRRISTVGGLTIASRILGFGRDILMATFLGAGFVADCFFVAFKLPNFFRRLFAEGAFNAAFVPIFCERLETGGKKEAKTFAEEALAVLLPTLLILLALFQIFMPQFMMVLAPGFIDEPDKFELAVAFTRYTFPYLTLISLVSLYAGILNGLDRFAVAASAPILLNIVLIASLLAFHETEILAGTRLSQAVTIAGVVQFFWLLFAASRQSFALRLRMPKLTPTVKEMLVIMMPAALGAGVIQVNLVIDIILASLLPEGSLSFLFYADRLNQLPIGVVGVAIGTVLLPSLSKTLAGGQKEVAIKQQSRAIGAAMLLTVPAAFALMSIPSSLIGALFERGAFSAADTSATAAALMAYAAGLPAYVLAKILTPAFYARKDTRTPVRLAIIALLVNLVLNLLLMGPFLHVGLAMATAISAWSNVLMLYLVLRRRSHYQLDRGLVSILVRILVASLLMAAVLVFAESWFADIFEARGSERYVATGMLVGLGLLVYVVSAFSFGLLKRNSFQTFMRGDS